MPLRVVAAGILLGLAAAAVVLAVVPPSAEVAQVHHVPGTTTPGLAGLAAAPGLDADASTLLGGRPDAAGVADAVDVAPGDGTLEVRARAETSAEAAVVAEAVGTVLERRAVEEGAVRAPRSIAVTADAPRDVGLRPQPAVVLGGGAILGLVAGLAAGGLLTRGVSSPEAGAPYRTPRPRARPAPRAAGPGGARPGPADDPPPRPRPSS